jgi:hypothetical protein
MQVARQQVREEITHGYDAGSEYLERWLDP